MATRNSFLRSIRENPNDNLPRLVFADWLDEQGECDRDRATAEYIRLTCQPVLRGRANAWLRDNWRRLCPVLAEGIIGAAQNRGGQRVWTIGPVLDVYYDPPYIPHYDRLSGIRLQLTFARGFCAQVRWRMRARNPETIHVAGVGALVRLLVGTDQRLAVYDEPVQPGGPPFETV